MTTGADRTLIAEFMAARATRSVVCNPVDLDVVTVAAARLTEQGFTEPRLQAHPAVPVGQLYLVDVDVFPIPATRP